MSVSKGKNEKLYNLKNKIRNERRIRQARLPRGAYELDILETIAPYKKKADEEKKKGGESHGS